MARILKRNILPMLLVLILCFGMVPVSAFAEAEITTTDNPAPGAQIEVLPAQGAEVTVVPNGENSDLIVESTPEETPSGQDPGGAASSSASSAGSSAAPSEPDASTSSSISSSAPESASAPQSASEPPASSSKPESAPSDTEQPAGSTENEAEEEPGGTVEIVRMGAQLFAANAKASGELEWTFNAGYQYDANQGLGAPDIVQWPTATINGQVAYCVEPSNMNTHASKPYGTIEYGQLTSAQRYSSGYAMLYGAQDTANIPFHIATQTIIWEIVHGFLDLESYTSTNKLVYDAVIG